MFKCLLVASLACLAAGPSHAQSGGTPRDWAETPVVTVRASETVSVKPDTATVTLGVQSFDATASATLSANAVKMERLLANLRSAGIPARSIKTGHVSLRPRYDGREQPSLIGYFADNSVQIQTSDLKGLGQLLDRVAAAGSGTIHGVNFSLKNDEQLRRSARQAALVRADEEAAFIARNRGFTSARVISVDTESSGRGDGDIIVTGRRIAGPSTPIEPGEVSVWLSVTVRYILMR